MTSVSATTSFAPQGFQGFDASATPTDAAATAQDAAAATPPNGTPVTSSSSLPLDSAVHPNIALQIKSNALYSEDARQATQFLLDSPVSGDLFQAFWMSSLLNSPQFKALSAENQQQVTANIKSLLQNGTFGKLKSDEKTAVLSQIKNYLDAHSIANVERLLGKDWFQSQSLGDKQRSLKLVAYLSLPDPNKKQNDIQNNTLDRFLSPDAAYKLTWESKPESNGNITFGHASDDALTLNSYLVAANNNPVRLDDQNEMHVIEHTAAHEVNHLVNHDQTSQTFKYLNEEYRAWYVGLLSQNGKPPSNREAMDRWEYFLNPNSIYANYSHEVNGSPGALDKPDEARKIFGLLSQLSGVNVTAGNYIDVMTSRIKWNTDPNAPASDKVFPSSDDLDN